MGTSLSPCPECSRHVHAEDAACPFCAAPLPARVEHTSALDVRASGTLSRAALLFAGASVVAACSSEPVPAYGPGPIRDASTDTSTDAAGSSDAAKDTGELDTGGPVALYGPAPVRDAGDG